MSFLIARTGRHRQRYQDNLRLVAGCIPYKIDKNIENGIIRKEEESVLVLMISSPNRDDLVFPKGGWEDDETLEQAASREAMEEAGVQGVLSESPLGVWEFRSKSSESSSSSVTVGGCRGYMFALEVTEELHRWPGQPNYTRKWLGTEEAYKLCRYDWMREALRKFVEDRKIIGKTEDVELGADHQSQMMSKGLIMCGKQPAGGVHQLHEESSTKPYLVIIYSNLTS